MNLDPPAAPAVFPAQADVLTAAKGGPYQDMSRPYHGHLGATSGPYKGISGPYQQAGSGADQLGAANQQKETTANARYGVGIPQSGEAELAGPFPNIQQLTAGMHHNVLSMVLIIFKSVGTFSSIFVIT